MHSHQGLLAKPQVSCNAVLQLFETLKGRQSKFTFFQNMPCDTALELSAQTELATFIS